MIKLYHNLLGLVKMNLKSDNRVACLVKEKDPFCGDGIVQVDLNITSKTMKCINDGQNEVLENKSFK